MTEMTNSFLKDIAQKKPSDSFIVGPHKYDG